MLTVGETGSLTGQGSLMFRSQLRKDFQPAHPSRLAPTPGSLTVMTGLLVSIIAFILDALIMPQSQPPVNQLN